MSNVEWDYKKQSRCPYCGLDARFLWADGIIRCDNCDAWEPYEEGAVTPARNSQE